jgi:prolyl-tRNA synthetase
VATFLRGDHQVNETKLLGASWRSELRTMQAEELQQFFNGPAGLFSGPWGSSRTCAAARRRPDRRHRRPRPRRPQEHGLRRQQARLPPAQRDARPRLHLDARRRHSQRERGRGLPEDGCAGKLVVGKAVEVGHIFKLGYKYTESMGARVLDPNGKEVTPIMGSYGIGIERILTAAIEQSNDANGFWLPASIAPFTVVVTITNVADAALRETGEKLAADLEAAGLDVLLDDRDERAGVKFKDADLVGIPYRINVGKKAAAGQVELVTRSTSTSVDVALERSGGAGEEARRGRKAAGRQLLAFSLRTSSLCVRILNVDPSANEQEAQIEARTS